MQYSMKAITLYLILPAVMLLLPVTFSIPCADDPGYTFGFTGNAPGERRTCEWLMRLKEVNTGAAERFCNMQWRHNIIKNKCPETCDECDTPSLIDCVDKTITTVGGDTIDWHDNTGTQYHCKYYSWGDNCFIFGKAFRNQGMTAQGACCACGGGDREN